MEHDHPDDEAIHATFAGGDDRFEDFDGDAIEVPIGADGEPDWDAYYSDHDSDTSSGRSTSVLRPCR